jgi:hypothetical protein
MSPEVTEQPSPSMMPPENSTRRSFIFGLIGVPLIRPVFAATARGSANPAFGPLQPRV